MIFFTMVLLFSTNVFSQQEYSFKHIDCNIRFHKTDENLNKMAYKKLEEKGYILKDFVAKDRMNVGDMYFTLERVYGSNKLWKDCIVTASVKKAKYQRANAKDKTLYSRSVKRSLPRVTFKGNERCRRALKDVFIHIPYCRPMSVNEKIQGN